MATPPINPRAPTVLTRFWAKVDDSQGPGGCWPWRGAKSISRGRIDYPYGVFKLSPPANGRPAIVVRTHRFALVLATGIDPDDQQACHDDGCCTTTLCCNPAHLRWGSDGENRLDWRRKYGYTAPPGGELLAGVLDQLEADGVI